MRYRHTHIGWVLMGILVPLTVLMLWAATAGTAPARYILIAVGVLLALCALLFFSLTVTVEDGHVDLRFGLGPIDRRVWLDDVESVHALRLPWWAVGFGLRMSLDGRRQLWRVSGWHAVHLNLSSGRELYIGTDQADALAAAIRAAADAHEARS
jgi:hypothetical protein